jgi:CIC family chloride channel protein
LKKMEERGAESWSHWQRIFPIVDAAGRLCGVLTRSQMIALARQQDAARTLLSDARMDAVTVSPFSTLRSCAAAMAETKLTSFPVVSADGRLLGVVTIEDLLKGRSEQSHRESDRERVLRLRWPFGGRLDVAENGAAVTVPAEDEEVENSESMV